MKSLTLPEIMATFSPLDRTVVTEPDLAGVVWDELDFLAWKDPSGHRGFLCVPLPERDVGLVLRLHPEGAAHGGLCDLCVAVDRVAGTSLALIDSWTRPRMTIGLHLCTNLDCSAGVRGRKWAWTMSETIPTGQRVERLQANVESLARRVTGLTVPGKIAR